MHNQLTSTLMFHKFVEVVKVMLSSFKRNGWYDQIGTFISIYICPCILYMHKKLWAHIKPKKNYSTYYHPYPMKTKNIKVQNIGNILNTNNIKNNI